MTISDREKWNQRYREKTDEPCRPNRWLLTLDALLPQSGRALDLAGGSGSNALWLAARGLDVTLVDVAEAGLAIAQHRAREQQLSIATQALDLSRNPLPRGPWDLVTCFCYLQRSLFGPVFEELAPGGLLVMLHPTLTNLQRHARPPRRFLLAPGELGELANKCGLQIIQLSEDWSEQGRHEARLRAQKPASC